MYGPQFKPYIHPASYRVGHVPVSRPGTPTFSPCACSSCQHPLSGIRPVSRPMRPAYTQLPYYSGPPAVTRRPQFPVLNYKSPLHPAVTSVQYPVVNSVQHFPVNPVQYPAVNPVKPPGIHPVQHPAVPRPVLHPGIQQTAFHPGLTHKPVYSYVDLIIMAIRNSPDQKATVEEIYSFIMFNFPYYRFCHPGWKNSIRHNLSVRKSTFAKIPRDRNNFGRGKGGYWSVVVNSEGVVMREKMTKPGNERKSDNQDSAESLLLSCSDSGSDDSLDISAPLDFDGEERAGLFEKFDDPEPATKRRRTETDDDENQNIYNKLEESFVDVTNIEDASSTTNSTKSTQNIMNISKLNLKRLHEKVRNLKRLSLCTKQ